MCVDTCDLKKMQICTVSVHALENLDGQKLLRVSTSAAEKGIAAIPHPLNANLRIK